ncbi:histidine kinase [Streptomyces diastatochromogenes]|nr:histidine kinase [Streptomyces diastatochromogenes]
MPALGDGRRIPGPFVALTATVVATVALGTNARTARAYLAALEERAARLEQHQDQQARLAVAEERTRIAREMHDIVTHNLSVMVALTDAAVQTQHRSPDRTTTAMLQVSETGRQALTDMRRSLGILRTDEPDAQRHPCPASPNSMPSPTGCAPPGCRPASTSSAATPTCPPPPN